MGSFFELTQKIIPALARARLLSGYQQITQQILTIRLAAKQEPTLMLLLQNEMNIQYIIGNIK